MQVDPDLTFHKILSRNVTKDKKPNMLSMKGGNFHLSKEIYFEFLNWYIRKKKPAYLVEIFHPELPKLAFDLDGLPEEMTAVKWGIFVTQLKELIVDYDNRSPWLSIVKRSDPRVSGEIKAYSYHFIVYNRAMTLDNQKLIAGMIQADVGIYKGQSLRMVGSFKKDETRKLVFELLGEDAQFEFVGVQGLFNLHCKASLLLPAEGTMVTPVAMEEEDYSAPEEEVVVVDEEPAIPELKWRQILQSTLKTTVNQGRVKDGAIQYNVNGSYCEIVKAAHNNASGRCVTISNSGIFYSCLAEKCTDKTKKLTVKEIPLAEIKKVFPVQNKRKREGEEKKGEKIKKVSDLSAAQYLMRFILIRLKEEGFSRFRTNVYKRITLPNGTQTSAFEKIDSIEEYIIKNTQPSVDEVSAEWVWRTSSERCIQTVEKELTKTEEKSPFFPKLNFCAHCHSFLNGTLYGNPHTMKVEFYPFPTKPIYPDGTDVIAVQHYNFDFDQTSLTIPWREIETPELDDLLKHQGLNDNTIEQIHMFAGRLLYPIDMLDSLGKGLYLGGKSNAGKSSASCYMSDRIPQELQCIISQEMRKTGNLNNFIDALFTQYPDAAPEGQGPLKEETAKKMVTGDIISLGQLYSHTHITLKWKSQILINSNHLTIFQNVGGSAERRWLTIIFLLALNNIEDWASVVRPRILKNYKRSIAKDLRAYFEMVSNISGGKWAKGDIFTHLDPYFTQSKDEIKGETNPVYEFLTNTEMLEREPDISNSKPSSTTSKYYIPLEDMTSLIKNNVKAAVNKKMSVEAEIALGLTRKKLTLCWPQGTTNNRTAFYVLGVRYTINEAIT